MSEHLSPGASLKPSRLDLLEVLDCTLDGKSSTREYRFARCGVCKRISHIEDLRDCPLHGRLPEWSDGG